MIMVATPRPYRPRLDLDAVVPTGRCDDCRTPGPLRTRRGFSNVGYLSPQCACRESRPWLWPAELFSCRLAVMITGHVPAVHVPPDHAASRVAAARPA